MTDTIIDLSKFLSTLSFSGEKDLTNNNKETIVIISSCEINGIKVKIQKTFTVKGLFKFQGYSLYIDDIKYCFSENKSTIIQILETYFDVSITPKQKVEISDIIHGSTLEQYYEIFGKESDFTKALLNLFTKSQEGYISETKIQELKEKFNILFFTTQNPTVYSKVQDEKKRLFLEKKDKLSKLAERLDLIESIRSFVNNESIVERFYLSYEELQNIFPHLYDYYIEDNEVTFQMNQLFNGEFTYFLHNKNTKQKIYLNLSRHNILKELSKYVELTLDLAARM